MIQFNDIFQIVADSFFNGSIEMAGVIVLVAILAAVMALSKKLITTLILAVPLIMIFAYSGFLPGEVGLVMLVIVALAIALQSRAVFD